MVQPLRGRRERLLGGGLVVLQKAPPVGDQAIRDQRDGGEVRRVAVDRPRRADDVVGLCVARGARQCRRGASGSPHSGTFIHCGITSTSTSGGGGGGRAGDGGASNDKLERLGVHGLRGDARFAFLAHSSSSGRGTGSHPPGCGSGAALVRVRMRVLLVRGEHLRDAKADLAHKRAQAAGLEPVLVEELSQDVSVVQRPSSSGEPLRSFVPAYVLVTATKDCVGSVEGVLLVVGHVVPRRVGVQQHGRSLVLVLDDSCPCRRRTGRPTGLGRAGGRPAGASAAARPHWAFVILLREALGLASGSLLGR